MPPVRDTQHTNPMGSALGTVLGDGETFTTLERRFGEEYREYRRNVPRWIPRLRPWQPPALSRR